MKSRIMLSCLAAVTALLVLGRSVGAEGSAGQAGAYLKLGVHARALGMGRAYVAACQDASAGYWNPAALGQIERQQVMLTYTDFPGSGDYSQIAYVLPVGEFTFPDDSQSGSKGSASLGAVALTVLRYAAAYDIEARQIDSLNPDYLFSDIEGCYGLAYGMSLGQDINLGLGIKGLYHELDQENANGWGLDFGLLWQAVPDLSLAVAVRDLYSTLSWTTGKQELFPNSIRAGAAYSRQLLAGHAVMLAADVSHNLTAAPLSVHVGLEYGWQEIILLRAGYDQEHWSYGGGVRLPWIGWGRAVLHLDYAGREDQISGWDHWLTLRLEM